MHGGSSLKTPGLVRRWYLRKALGVCRLPEGAVVSAHAVFPAALFIRVLSVDGEGRADGEVCVAGLASSVRGAGRVCDGVGR